MTSAGCCGASAPGRAPAGQTGSAPAPPWRSPRSSPRPSSRQRSESRHEQARAFASPGGSRRRRARRASGSAATPASCWTTSEAVAEHPPRAPSPLLPAAPISFSGASPLRSRRRARAPPSRARRRRRAHDRVLGVARRPSRSTSTATSHGASVEHGRLHRAERPRRAAGGGRRAGAGRPPVRRRAARGPAPGGSSTKANATRAAMPLSSNASRWPGPPPILARPRGRRARRRSRAARAGGPAIQLPRRRPWRKGSASARSASRFRSVLWGDEYRSSGRNRADVVAGRSARAADPRLRIVKARARVDQPQEGPVMNIVTSAMITSIVNSARRDHAKSSPMFRTISSVNPRVFISAPIAAESRQAKPVSAAATHRADELPTIASAIRTQRQHPSTGRFSRPTSVFRPVTTKKSGRRSEGRRSPRSGA